MTPTPYEAFNGDSHVEAELNKLIARFAVKHCIETGMWAAKTTRQLRTMVSGQVITMDPDFSNLIKEFGPTAVYDLATLGISPRQQDSAVDLHDIIHSFDDEAPVLFYLDAHGGGINGTSTNPLREELEQIADSPWCHNNCVILIHDFQNPNHPDWGYNGGDWFGQAEPLSMALLQKFDVLPRIFPNGWEHHYNEATTGIARGVVYIYPKP